MMKRLLVVLGFVALCASTTVAQQTLKAGAITTNGDIVSAILGTSTRSIAIQVSGTWTGTITFQGSTDGVTFVSLLASNASSSTTSTSTTANGLFIITNGGFAMVRATATASITGRAIVSIMEGYGSGGAGGGNAAASATGSAVPSSASYTAYNSGGNLVGVDTTNRLPVTCDNCGGGTGGTAAGDNSAFTFGTTSTTPASFVFDDVSPNAVTENRIGTPRMAANRVPYAQLRDAAGNERGANVNASNELLVAVSSIPAHSVTNAGVFAVQAAQSGTWTVQPGNTANTTAWFVAGGKTNNNAAPGATNVGALIGIANASAPTWTEGNMVGASFDLGGALRVSGAGGGTQYTHDGPLTVGSSVGTMAMGRASAAVPTDVTADNDAVLPWYLRSGAQATQPTFGGVLQSTGNGVAGTGTPRVTIASDNTAFSVTAAGALANDGVAAATNRVPTLPGITENAAPTRTDGRNAAFSFTTGGAARVMLTNAAGAAATLASDQTFGTSTYTEATTTGPLVGGVRTDTPATLGNTNNEIVPFAMSALGGVYSASASDPCSRLAKTYVVINISSATTTVLVSASASNKLYVCSLAIGPVGAAQNIALVEDATAACASPDAGLYGGTTTGTGMIFPVNGGLTLGNGEGTVLKTASTNVNVCAISSSTGQTSGVLGYVLAP